MSKIIRPKIDADLNQHIETLANAKFNGNFTKAANFMIRSFSDSESEDRISYLNQVFSMWFDDKLTLKQRESLGVDMPLSELVRNLFDIK